MTMTIQTTLTLPEAVRASLTHRGQDAYDLHSTLLGYHAVHALEHTGDLTVEDVRKAANLLVAQGRADRCDYGFYYFRHPL